MADEVSEEFKNALNIIVNTAERNGNMKKQLMQTIFEILSTARHLFVKLKDSRDGKSIAISELELIVTKMKAEVEECRGKNIKKHGASPLILSQEPDMMTARGEVPSGDRVGKLYLEALRSEENLKRFKLTVKTKEKNRRKQSKITKIQDKPYRN